MDDNFILYVVDTETTNLDTKLGDVIEVSMCRLSIEDEIKSEQKTWLLKAMNPTMISDESLAVNKHKREDILHLTKYGKDNYKLPEDVVSEIELWVACDNVSSVDRVFIGQNPNFDIQALQELWSRVGSPSTFPFAIERGNRVIDTKQIVTLFDVCVGRRRLYYNLGSLVKSFGIKKDKAHSAAGDVAMTRDLLIKLLTPIKSIVTESFKDCYLNEDIL
jgi:DNA polymerase III epsilon subunit-like protein